MMSIYGIFLLLLASLIVSIAFQGRINGLDSIKRVAPHGRDISRGVGLYMQGGFFDFMNQGSGGSSKTSKSGKVTYCVVTGTTSGLGRATVRSLLEDYEENYFVICANRNVDKAQDVHESDGLDPSRFKCVKLDLASFESTRNFAKNLPKVTKGKPLDRLCCNAAVYQPALPTPKFTADGIEEQLQINHLSHYLLVSLLLPQLKKSRGRCTIVGSITGNTNTIGGGLVLPFANLGQLEGMEKGSIDPVAMIDGKAFNGAKAYKDSKICNMMTVNELHKRYHDTTGVVFNSMYPGCIAETQLFREKRVWFQRLFPLFMKYVTGGYVSEYEAGQRLAQVVAAPETSENSGVYWSWNGGAREIPKRDFKRGVTKGTGGGGGGRESIFINTPSDEVADEVKSEKMWRYSQQITGARWM